MAEVLLVNPRRRGRPGRRRNRTAAQKAATRKMIASNRRRGGRSAKRRRNPIGPYARSGNMGYYVSNPRRRKRRAPVRRRRSRTRYRRNPRMTMRSVLNNTVVPAMQAAGGAIALDFVWGFVPIPLEMKTGPMRHVVKGLGAIVIGQIAGQVVNKRVGDNMAMGALTVVFHAAFRELIANVAPNVPLSYYSAGPDAGADPSLGYYVSSPRLGTQGGESIPVGMNANSEMGYYVQEGAGAQY